MKELKILPKVNEYGCYEIRMESIGGLGANVAGKMLAQTGIISMGLNGANFSQYGSEKMGSPVKGYVRFTEEDAIRINSPVMQPHLLALFSANLAKILNVLEGLEKGNAIVVTTNKSPQEIRDELKIPGGVTLYCVDGVKIAMEEKVRLNTTMMGAMAKASGFIDPDAVKEFISKTFEKRYPHLVEGNLRAFDRGYNEVKVYEIPDDGKYPFQEFEPYESSLGWDTAPEGGTITDFGNAYEKDLSGSRVGKVPVYHEERCIHCGQCDIVCPDMAMIWADGVDKKGNPARVMVGIDYKHCKGCLKCVEVCPVKPDKALTAEVEADLDEEALAIVVENKR